MSHGGSTTGRRPAPAIAAAAEDDIRLQAMQWFTRLRERPDDPELADRLADWLAADPHHAAAYTEAERVWRVAGHLRPSAASTAVRPASPTRRRRAEPPRRAWAGAALAVAATLLVAVLNWPTLHLHLNADAVSGTAEIAHLDMPDGSTITMGPESAVSTHYAAGARTISLHAGEAFFSVTPDKDRPFSVRTGDLTVTAVGTAFDVRVGRDTMTVEVAEGTVRVDAPPSFAETVTTLSAGQRLIAAPSSGAMHVEPIPPAQVAAWRTHRLVVEGTTLGSFLHRLEPYLHGHVVVTAPALLDLSISGVYDLERPVDALRAAFGTHGITVSKVAPYLFVAHRW
ncbi:hypothetical protein C882_0730 [Caenispirillum salinarum AK4]|uniref:Uncharacterized protein n=1 Tax=Caenispirillum salinarum AK4 TaxID=1238182 RepID=K9HK26_9PROT|nr:FecR domain-containing protein [Caenispirillum salinarum]EKV28966.1 hypothetical protein C882_0730 [Caenispirillum salinarum AK4]